MLLRWKPKMICDWLLFGTTIRKNGLGKTFVSRIKERVHSLTTNPYICQVRYKCFHTAIVEQFPYMIHYTIDDSSNTFFIIAIIHTSQNPQKWNERDI